MTETQYNRVTNLTKLHIANHVLRDVFLSRHERDLGEKQRIAVSAIAEMIDELQSRQEADPLEE